MLSGEYDMREAVVNIRAGAGGVDAADFAESDPVQSALQGFAGASGAASLSRYFDGNSRKTQTAVSLMQQVQLQMKTLELPRVDDTLSALSTAAAGR